MDASKNSLGACALIFSEDSVYTKAMLVSNPPPLWLSEDDLTKIRITESGVYCLYLLFAAANGTYACISINDRPVPGSALTAEDGVICSSAVCSIHDEALPCTLTATTNTRRNSGIFLVVRCRV